MNPADQVTMTVNGTDFGGWTSISINAGITRAARDASLSITRKWPNAGDAAALSRVIKRGDLVQIRIGGELVLTGYVDALPVSYDGSSITRSIRVRSKTADLVDCGAQKAGGQFRERTLGQIATELAKPFGIKVLDQSGATERISDHQIDPGETCFESICRCLELRHALAYDDASGNLLLTRVNQGAASGRLEFGVNIRECDAQQDYTGCFSEYVVRGQRSATDLDAGKSVSQLKAKAGDAAAGRYRPMVMKLSGQASTSACITRAQFEARRRKAAAREATYTVTGWRKADGKLWRPNERVMVIDPVAGYDEAMVISELTFSLDGSGQSCTMTLGPPDAYMPEPADPPKKTGKKAVQQVM